MAIREDVLRLLEEHRGENLSGEFIAERLFVSRVSVWKAVKALRNEGHKIGAAPRRGYRLEAGSDVLTEEGIRARLSKGAPIRRIICLASVGSTNTYAKELALSGAEHGTLIVADSQTAGRGRRGRSFFSPAGTGLYMSLILRPHVEMERFVLVTVAAAVAVCRTIESLTEASPRIKWVNDVFLEGQDGAERKICGILTEAVSDVESGSVETVVVGIGLNVKTKAFAPELRDVAGSLSSETVRRDCLAAGIAERLMKYQERLDAPELMRLYRDRSLLLGREIRYLRDGVEHHGHALDIDVGGGLIVRDRSGETAVLRSGEVYEVRPSQGPPKYEMRSVATEGGLGSPILGRDMS
ncbi:biotin--[acetyl-CoA-carboxylase] ligase [Fretibacterium sp. OH1220_COT-178]|nr:biotin--[acetyl-CoA-carboxylase] ligase [Fretibacterium sp. OH1220_COT-178]